jgi:chemotaxis methyl-accepting protein methylase
VQVFATDLDEEAIVARARDGLYSESDLADLPEGRIARFFSREGGRFPRPARAARADALRASQRHQGSAVPHISI